MTVRGIIAAAYGAPQPLPLFRVIGGPSRIDADRYDVDAITASEMAGDLTPPWPRRGGAMLQALMKERFRLTAHKETRNVPAYDLVVANRDRGLGPQLTASTVPARPIHRREHPSSRPCRNSSGSNSHRPQLRSTSW